MGSEPASLGHPTRQHPADRLAWLRFFLLGRGLEQCLGSQSDQRTRFDSDTSGRGLAVTYANQGAGAIGADFFVKWIANGSYREGNSYYRFWVPPPGKSNDTGGMGINLFDLRPGQRVKVTAEVDWENRVRESDEDNNRLTKWVQLGPDSSFLTPPVANAEGTIRVGQEKLPIRCAYALREKERSLTIHLLPFVPQAQDISAL